jgi:hypothetical protein
LLFEKGEWKSLSFFFSMSFSLSSFFVR